MNSDRTLPWDWHPGRVPDNVIVAPEAYLETTYSFECFRSHRPESVRIGRGASIYLGVMFDLGPNASVSIGEFSLLNGSRIICDASITIGAYCLISWNTVLMDSHRVPRDTPARHALLEAVGRSPDRHINAGAPAAPIVIGNGVWLGFDSCVLPGVEIGDGAIVGARSVVVESVPAYSIVAGNPARVVRQLDPAESQKAVAAAIAQFNPNAVSQ
ncbi:MAG TPA: acyltransferase [Verrucomicrobiae bacterium]|nr:acyltransferase [Verrucomicrobiae bacterium]